MLYRLIGICRCPYINECGPDKMWMDYDEEEKLIERQCFTRKHHECLKYQARKKLEEKVKR